MHVGSVARFAPPPDDPFDYEALCALVSRRIALVPRYRQKVRWVPGSPRQPGLGRRRGLRHHLPRPPQRAAASRAATPSFAQLVGRLQSRQLDRNRPLWEIYLVEGLADGRFAIITKTHHAMVDGISAVDIGTLILDLEPTPRETAGRRLDAAIGAVPASAWSRDADRRHAAPPVGAHRHGAQWDRPTPGPPPSVPLGARSAESPRSPARRCASAPESRSTPRSASSDGSGWRRPRSTTTSGSARPTAARSTTSSSRPSPARCGPGC